MVSYEDLFVLSLYYLGMVGILVLAYYSQKKNNSEENNTTGSTFVDVLEHTHGAQSWADNLPSLCNPGELHTPPLPESPTVTTPIIEDTETNSEQVEVEELEVTLNEVQSLSPLIPPPPPSSPISLTSASPTSLTAEDVPLPPLEEVDEETKKNN